MARETLPKVVSIVRLARPKDWFFYWLMTTTAHNRAEYFRKVHNDLGAQYHIDPHTIAYIRSFTLGKKLTKEAVIAHLSHKASNRSLMVDQYRLAAKRHTNKRDQGAYYNAQKLAKIEDALTNLEENLSLINKTLDTILRISPATWDALLVKTEMDKHEIV